MVPTICRLGAATLAVVAALSIGCTGGETIAERHVARGWHGRAESLFLTGCRPERATPARLFVMVDENSFEAKGVGTLRVPCDEGTLVFHIRDVAIVRLEGPQRIAIGEHASVRLLILDDTGQVLQAPGSMRTTWELPEIAGPAPKQAHDWIGAAVSLIAPPGIDIVGIAPGVGWVRATIEGLPGLPPTTTELQLSVTPAP